MMLPYERSTPEAERFLSRRRRFIRRCAIAEGKREAEGVAFWNKWS
jgi:hypothetical protein